MHPGVLARCPPLQALPGPRFLGPFVWTFDLPGSVDLLFPSLCIAFLVALSIARPQRFWRRILLVGAGLIVCLVGYYLANVVFGRWLYDLTTWQATVERVILETPNIDHLRCMNALLDNPSVLESRQHAAILQDMGWVVMFIGYFASGALFIQVMRERYGHRVAAMLQRAFDTAAGERMP